MCHRFYFPADYVLAGKNFGKYWHHTARGAYQHTRAVVGLDNNTKQ
jgi:hypothetical protein